MSDIRLTWDNAKGAADFRTVKNDLEADDGLETAVLLSLYTDRRAEPNDALPDGGTDRRGWWADAVPVVSGDLFGSRLWLLSRSKQTPDVLARAEEYALEALQWLLDDKVVESVEIVELKFPKLGQMTGGVRIKRPARDSVTFKFNRTWQAQESRA